MGLDADAPQVVRAREIISSWLERPGVIGAYLTGSAVRPSFDSSSDLDVVVVLEDDVFSALHPDKRYKMGIDRGPPRRKAYDLMIRSWSMTEGYRSCDVDLYRFFFQYVHMLHDPSGRLTELIRTIAELPPSIRDERMRVHYHEYMWNQTKAIKSIQRGHVTSARMVQANALTELTKFLFLVQGSWPAKLSWAPQELRWSGVPDAIVDRLEAAWANLEHGDAELKKLVDDWLTSKGIDFHLYTVALTNWIAIDPIGVAAVLRWVRTH